MEYLLDTNVVSEFRKGGRANPGVVEWMGSVAEEELYLSAIVIGEIRQGIENLRRRDPVQAEHLETWLSGLRATFADMIIPVDIEIAEEWGRMNVPNPRSTRDSLMAATAKVRNMTLVTRNVSDVEGTGVRVLDPFSP